MAEEDNLPPRDYFRSTPVELILKIFTQCESPSDMLALARTCGRLSTIWTAHGSAILSSHLSLAIAIVKHVEAYIQRPTLNRKKRNPPPQNLHGPASPSQLKGAAKLFRVVRTLMRMYQQQTSFFLEFRIMKERTPYKERFVENKRIAMRNFSDPKCEYMLTGLLMGAKRLGSISELKEWWDFPQAPHIGDDGVLYVREKWPCEISRKKASALSQAFNYSFADGDCSEGMQRIGRWLRMMLAAEEGHHGDQKFFESVEALRAKRGSSGS
ncbi:hypothetical protein QBC34DRAFT_460210 [Podospora aff. communis PSN243]|uniref:F-box domain-containing protein n=1 Tax=Podospora aff. communis PSN243 TaxID=3040156 RepID=A0AAV9H3Z2_9PEZI|nr:hypothetical protein QBC34DRAFT_460210 [Podospora aff. communis PSN243]